MINYFFLITNAFRPKFWIACPIVTWCYSSQTSRDWSMWYWLKRFSSFCNRKCFNVNQYIIHCLLSILSLSKKAVLSSKNFFFPRGAPLNCVLIDVVKIFWYGKFNLCESLWALSYAEPHFFVTLSVCWFVTYITCVCCSSTRGKPSLLYECSDQFS